VVSTTSTNALGLVQAWTSPVTFTNARLDLLARRLLTRFAEWQRHGSAVDAAVNAATVNATVNG